ncbi:MAG: LLM class flavin-dependent oxidoreductase [Saprospiraceae bacterium]
MDKNKGAVKYSILDLALISEGSTTTETLQKCLNLAQQAEEFGYHRYWLAEHHNSISIASSATSVLIGYIAGGTKKIRVGSGGIMLPNHSPLIVAEQFGTLGSLYPNRIDLGLGRAPGTDQETAFAIRSDRMNSVYKFPEEIQKIQQYFSNENADAKVRANVAEGVDVPIYILGSSTDSAHLAAKKGLPYAFASHFATAQLFEALNIYHNEFQPSELLQEPYAMAAANVIVADHDEEAERYFTSLIRGIIGILTGKRNFLQPPTEMTPDLIEVRKHPAVEQMLKYSFVGSKNTVKKKTQEFLAQTKIKELIAVTNIYDAEDRVKSYQMFSEIMKKING